MTNETTIPSSNGDTLFVPGYGDYKIDPEYLLSLNDDIEPLKASEAHLKITIDTFWRFFYTEEYEENDYNSFIKPLIRYFAHLLFGLGIQAVPLPSSENEVVN